MHVLLLEDDPMIGESVRQALESEGMTVCWMRTGRGIESVLAENGFDALLLDLTLPQMDGMTILRAMRRRGDRTPVLIITARDAIADRIGGLDAGADDYLVKPFDIDELMARLRAQIRRFKDISEPVYRRNGVLINCEAREVSLNGASVLLSAREWELLSLLVSRPGTIHSRRQIEAQLYGVSGEVDSNVIEVHIHSLRRKLNADLIVNVRGVGYMVPKK